MLTFTHIPKVSRLWMSSPTGSSTRSAFVEAMGGAVRILMSRSGEYRERVSEAVVVWGCLRSVYSEGRDEESSKEEQMGDSFRKAQAVRWLKWNSPNMG